VLSPNCPYWLLPAQSMISPGRTTQVCNHPGASSAKGLTAERVDEAVEEAVDVDELVLVLVCVSVECTRGRGVGGARRWQIQDANDMIFRVTLSEWQ